MKKNKLTGSNGVESEAKRAKKSDKNHQEEGEKQEQEEDDITSTLALQNDLNARITRNPFASRVKQPKRLIVVLENASLETVKVGKVYELLNCDRHKQYIIKHRKDPSQCRPDILHQCLLMLFDSPLNRASLLQVYVHSLQNTLIEINPQTRIPRTFDRFCGLMVQLLHKMSIRAADTGDGKSGGQKLLKVIKNPVTDHLPVGCPKYLSSFHAEKVVNVSEFADNHPSDQPIVVVIGAMAKGSVDCDYTDKAVSISNYPLSAAITCSKFCTAFEDKWNIL